MLDMVYSVRLFTEAVSDKNGAWMKFNIEPTFQAFRHSKQLVNLNSKGLVRRPSKATRRIAWTGITTTERRHTGDSTHAVIPFTFRVSCFWYIWPADLQPHLIVAAPCRCRTRISANATTAH